jgi:hypothetical protein
MALAWAQECQSSISDHSGRFKEMSKNEIVKLLLAGVESKLIDARPGARSLWLGPARATKARLKKRREKKYVITIESHQRQGR